MPVINRKVPQLPDGRYIVVPDIQSPYHDPILVALMQRYIKDANFDGIMNVGDEIDLPQVSRWHAGQKLEFTDTLQEHIDINKEIQRGFREALGPGKPFFIVASNHGNRRWNEYLKKAPAISGLECLDYARAMGYDDPDLDIQYLGQPFEFAPGWLLMHGDEAKGLSQIAGTSAAKLGDKTATSVIQGHTHRLGYQPKTRAAYGKPNSVLHAIEAGNLMDMSKADYLMNVGGNWQHGFIVVNIIGRRVHHQIVSINERREFFVDGRLYTPKTLKGM